MTIDPTRPPKKSPRPVTGSPLKRARQSGVPAPAERIAMELHALERLRTIFGSARTHDAEVRRSAAISGSQLWALAEIARSQGVTVNGLSAQMALHQTTTSNLVNSLVEKKLIRRVRDDADQRIVHLHASVQGKQLLLRVPAPHAGLLVDALRRLDPSALEQLCETLGWLVALMRRTAQTAAGETLMGE